MSIRSAGTSVSAAGFAACRDGSRRSPGALQQCTLGKIEHEMPRFTFPLRERRALDDRDVGLEVAPRDRTPAGCPETEAAGCRSGRRDTSDRMRGPTCQVVKRYPGPSAAGLGSTSPPSATERPEKRVVPELKAGEECRRRFDPTARARNRVVERSRLDAAVREHDASARRNRGDRSVRR